MAGDMEYLDFGTIFFFVAAVVIFLQLRKVLGRRTGNERPPFNPYASSRTAEVEAKAKPGDNVVSLPRAEGKPV
jgi:predicted lipid-binding transport protein (Tim44 family)